MWAWELTREGSSFCLEYIPGGFCDPQALAPGLEAAPNIRSQCSGLSWKILGMAAVTHCPPECSW